MKRRQFIKALFTGAALVAAKPLLKLLPKEEPKELWRSAVHPFMANGLVASDTGSLTYDMLHNAIERCKEVQPLMPEVIYLPPAMYKMLQENTVHVDHPIDMLAQVRINSHPWAFKTTKDYFDINLKPVKTTIILNKPSGADFYI